MERTAVVELPRRAETRDFPSWPTYSEREIQAVEAVLRSGKVNYWTGTECRDFEREFAEYCGVKHAIALANGTVALELAMRMYGIGPGDEVIVTPRTFIASASAVSLQGAKPVFADIDRTSQNITAESISEKISSNTRAIIAVHLAGWPCDMDPILELARTHNLIVIEDCAQAHGASYKGRPVGSMGDAAAFSFCQDKIMSTGGEGGMLVTDDTSLWERAWAFKDHGKSHAAVYERDHAPGFRWLHESFGTNWRMTEMQAAIGRIQLTGLDEGNLLRARNAKILTRRLSESAALRIAIPQSGIGHAWYKYYAFVCQEKLAEGWTRDRIMQAVCAQGVPCFSGSCSEIYLEQAFAEGDSRPETPLPIAHELGETSLMFLVHPTLSEADMNLVADVMIDVLLEASA